MSEERRGRATTDPMELWRQWYETGARMWSDAFEASQGNNMDPYGLYRQWFNGMQNLQERMFGGMGGASPLVARNGSLTSPAPSPGAGELPSVAKPAADAVAGQAAEVQNLWKQWFEASQDFWRKAVGLGAEAVELTPRWVAMLDQIRNNLLSAEGYPTDPLQFATRWYNATNGPLSDFLDDLIEREETLDVSSQFLQSYASFYKVFRRNSEEYLKGLSIPVRSDITRVAGLVVALEDKVDRVEEAFEDFEYGYAEPATAESVQGIESRIEGLEQRLADVEGKIDRILTALENGSVQETEAPQKEESGQETEEVRATAAARRKARELGVELSEVDGTGANGQVTVDDVRRESARGEEGES